MATAKPSGGSLASGIDVNQEAAYSDSPALRPSGLVKGESTIMGSRQYFSNHDAANVLGLGEMATLTSCVSKYWADIFSGRADGDAPRPNVRPNVDVWRDFH